MLAIINSFNLIDGIDGLAAGLSILAAFVFGSWFFIAGQIQFSIMSFALVGSLSGFFLFNVYGKKNKLFMGDTGSLMIGLIISTLVIKFNEFNIIHNSEFVIGAAPAVSFAIIIVPLIDTLKVMSIRIYKGKSPFTPDNNHIHHRILVLVPNHLKVTLIIVGVNSIFISMALLLNHFGLNINAQFLIIFITGILSSIIPSILIRIKFTLLSKKSKLAKQFS
jgi:UDP-N-acetylmuramyl pentapeptide phosphotransferase/UDP-N-acetylglucosamine-1-phosphate transferase